MSKKCAICNEEISEDNGKIKGTMLKMVEDKQKRWIYVCSLCMKKNPDKYLETAKIKSA